MRVTEIDAMVAEGFSFEDIEDRINETQEDADVKAALWLYAWTLQERDGQRAVVREMVRARGLAD